MTAPDGTAFDFFGSSVAIDGDTAAVGSPLANDGRGAVYVFTRAGDSWTQTAKLTVQPIGWEDVKGVGASVAIDGDTIVAGATEYSVFAGPASTGAVYTFARTGASERNQSATLFATDGAANDRLGSSVAIDGDTIVAGAPFHASAGAVYTFARTGAVTRTQTAKLTAAGGGVHFLGSSVAIDGDTIVAGAPREAIAADAGQGSVYAFARTGPAQRNPVAKLTVAEGAAQDRLGESVAIEGDVVVAGAPFDDVAGDANQGSAYTFARTGAAARSEIAQLTSSDGAADDWLGLSVALEGDTIVAGAPLVDVGSNTSQGAAYTFARTGAARTERTKLIASDGGNDELGSSVAIDTGQIIVGARHDSVGANTSQGSAWIYFSPAAVPPVVPPVPPPVPIPPAAPPRPSVSGFGFAPSKIAVGRKATAIAAAARGGRFRYTLNTAARVTIVIERKLAGRRQGRRCVSPKKRLKRKCTRYKRSGTLTRTGNAGRNTTAFSGRIGSRALARGSYRATITATNASGTSTRRTTSFKVVRAGKRRR